MKSAVKWQILFVRWLHKWIILFHLCEKLTTWICSFCSNTQNLLHLLEIAYIRFFSGCHTLLHSHIVCHPLVVSLKIEWEGPILSPKINVLVHLVYFLLYESLFFSPWAVKWNMCRQTPLIHCAQCLDPNLHDFSQWNAQRHTCSFKYKLSIYLFLSAGVLLNRFCLD